MEIIALIAGVVVYVAVAATPSAIEKRSRARMEQKGHVPSTSNFAVTGGKILDVGKIRDSLG